MKKNLNHAKAVLVLTMALTLLLTGCMGRTAADDAFPSPTVMTEQGKSTAMSTQQPDLPMIDNSSDNTLSGNGGIQTVEGSKTASKEMEDAVALLTEVDDAYAVAFEDCALIGLKFNEQYQGELDERIKRMVYSRVQTVSRETKKLYITADTEQKNAIEDLSSHLEMSDSMDDIAVRFRELAAKIPVYTE